MNDNLQFQAVAMSDPTLREMFGIKEPTARELLISQVAVVCDLHNIQEYFEIVRMVSSIAGREGGKVLSYYHSIYAKDEKHTQLAQKRLVNAILRRLNN